MKNFFSVVLVPLSERVAAFLRLVFSVLVGAAARVSAWWRWYCVEFADFNFGLLFVLLINFAAWYLLFAWAGLL